MFNKKIFAQLRISGMGVKPSKTKLSEAMLDILLQLPAGTTNLKETIVYNMGFLGQMSTTRDINEAWNQAKKRAAKLYPEKFILANQNKLLWNDGSEKVLDKEISAANFKKLNELADIGNCSVDKLITKLIKYYKKENLK